MPIKLVSPSDAPVEHTALSGGFDVNFIHMFLFRGTLLFVFALTLFFPHEGAFALEETTPRFTTENWHTLPHPKILSFSVNEDGSASGVTETGIPFIQKNIETSLPVRIQRFEIQDYYHYILEGEIVYTEAELSEKLTALIQ